MQRFSAQDLDNAITILHRIVTFLLPPIKWYGFSNQLHKKVALKSRVFWSLLSPGLCYKLRWSSWLRFLRLCLCSLLVLPSLSSSSSRQEFSFSLLVTASVLLLPTRCFRTILPCLQVICIHMLRAPPMDLVTQSPHGERALFTSQSSFMQGCSSLCP